MFDPARIVRLRYVRESDPEVLREAAQHLTDQLRCGRFDAQTHGNGPWLLAVETRDHMLEIAEAIEDGRSQGLPRLPKRKRGSHAQL